MAFYVYLIEQIGTPYTKIGVSDDPVRRLQELHRMNPSRLALRYTLLMANRASGFELEAALHRQFSDDHHRAEWYKVLPDNVIAHILRAPDLLANIASVTEYPDWIIEHAAFGRVQESLAEWMNRHPYLMSWVYFLTLYYSWYMLHLPDLSWTRVAGYSVAAFASLVGAFVCVARVITEC